MINQSTGPSNPGDILYFVQVMLFIVLLCMGYSLSRPELAVNKDRELFLLDTTGADLEDGDWADLPSWQKKASEKAVERYAATQNKKWRRWNEAMFERSS